MKIVKRKMEGVYEIILQPHVDARGAFMRTFDERIFQEQGLNKSWVQENHSKNTRKGTIRGLHMQLPPYSECKLVRAVKGSVFDVFVDLRIGSPTFGQWDSIELSENNNKMIMIPRGFAHAYCTFTEAAEVFYKVDNYYAPDFECGIMWNDSDINIKWPVKEPILSLKDENNFSLSEALNLHEKHLCSFD